MLINTNFSSRVTVASFRHRRR